MESAEETDWAAIRAGLIAESVPAAVADYVVALRPPSGTYQFASLSFTVLLVGGLLLGASQWGFFEALLDDNALARARSMDALLYAHNFGFSFLGLLFAWIFIANYILSFLGMLSERARAGRFLYTLFDHNSRGELSFGDRLRKLAHISEPQEYVKAVLGAMDKANLHAGLILAVLGSYLLLRELDTYEIYTPEGYLATPLFPWDGEDRRAWKDARSVELGCNHVEGKRRGDHIIYEVEFDDGADRRVSAAAPVDGDYVAALAAIDATLRASDAQFKRWEWLKRDPLHPDCLASLQRRYSKEDYARLKRILQVGEHSSDRV